MHKGYINSFEKMQFISCYLAVNKEYFVAKP